MTLDDAIEEVVADACEEMLISSRYAQLMARERPALAQSIYRWLKDFTEKIKAAIVPASIFL